MMNKLRALTLHYSYSPLVLREGSIHKIALADIIHSEDWNTKLILYPPDSDICPGNLREASEFINSLLSIHVDVFGLIKSGYAISVTDLLEDPYEILYSD